MDVKIPGGPGGPSGPEQVGDGIADATENAAAVADATGPEALSPDTVTRIGQQAAARDSSRAPIAHCDPDRSRRREAVLPALVDE